MNEPSEGAGSGALLPEATESGAVELTAPEPSPEIAVPAPTAAGMVSLDRLASRLDSLEQRVAALEHRGAAQMAPTLPAAMRMRPAAESGAAAAASAFSVLGKAMLGIAGAYLLRALAQADAGLRPAVGWAGILYALFWLAAAARARSGASLLQIAYASTSALILAPMLWELTLGFQVLSPAATACALAVFVGVAFAFSWKRNLGPVVWIAQTGAAALALALAIATHALLPFVVLLVLMVLLAEVAEERGCGHGTRVLAAAAADAALWIQIYLDAPVNTRLEHPAPGALARIAPAVALFLFTGGSALGRAILRRTPMTVFEIFQATISFLLAAISLLIFAPAAGAVALPVACLVLAAGLYAVSFTRFQRVGAARNSAVFATWSAALLLAGLWMTLAEPWLVVALGSAAVAATLGARLRQQLLLELHGAVYLVAAALASGLAEFVAQALAGPMPAMPSHAVGLSSACTLLCAAAAPSQPGEGRGGQALHLLFALAGTACAAALLVTTAAHGLALGFALGSQHLAFLRTLVLCGLALALAFAGPRLRRLELARVGYVTLALVAAKLVSEDLRHGHLAYSAGSIFLFAIALIAMPRVTRGSTRLRAKSQA